MSPEQERELRHELRTPVNHLIGYAELLLEEDGISATNTSNLESIRTVARQVLELVPYCLAIRSQAPEETRMQSALRHVTPPHRPAVPNPYRIAPST